MDVRPQKPQKIDPLPLSAKCPYWLNYPLYVRTHHKFKKSDVFCTKKVRTSASEEPPSPFVRKMTTLDKPPPSD